MSDAKPFERLWTLDAPSSRRPAEVIWDAPSAKDVIEAAKRWGWVVRGPYILESAVSELRAALERIEREDHEHGPGWCAAIAAEALRGTENQ